MRYHSVKGPQPSGEPIPDIATYPAADRLLAVDAQGLLSHAAAHYERGGLTDSPSPAWHAAAIVEVVANLCRPTHIVVAIGESDPNERREDEALLRLWLGRYEIPIHSHPGEGAEIVATVVCQWLASGQEAVIVSPDQRFHPFLGPAIYQAIPDPPGRDYPAAEIVDFDGIEERTGILPRQFPDLLALTGLPFAERTGVLTEDEATSLLAVHGTLRRILSALEDISPQTAALLQEHQQTIEWNRTLAVLTTNLEVQRENLELPAPRFLSNDVAAEPLDATSFFNHVRRMRLNA